MFALMSSAIAAAGAFGAHHEVWDDAVLSISYDKEVKGNDKNVVRVNTRRIPQSYDDRHACISRYIDRAESMRIGDGMWHSAKSGLEFRYRRDNADACRTEKIGAYVWSYLECPGIDPEAEIIKLSEVATPLECTNLTKSAYVFMPTPAVSPEPKGVIQIPPKLGGRKVVAIGHNAFKGFSGLTAVKIPAGVRRIDPGAFDGCANLASIEVDRANEYYSSAGGLLIYDRQPKVLRSIERRGTAGFSMTRKGLLKALGECPSATYLARVPPAAKAVSVPPSVLGIMPKAFAGCRNLTGVNLPSGIKYIGYEAFSGCENMSKLTIPDSVEELIWDEYEGWENVYSVGSYSEREDFGVRFLKGLFHGCNSLRSVELNGKVPGCWLENGFLLMKGGAVWRDGKDRVVLVKCLAGGKVCIPPGVKMISDGAFAGCAGITSFEVSNGNTEYSAERGLLLSKDGRKLVKCTNGEVSIPDRVTHIAYRAFFECPAVKSFSVDYSKTNKNWPRTFAAVDGSLLSYDRKTLVRAANATESVKVPDCVETIGAEAFSGSRGVVEIVFPGSVGSIRASFDGCDSLRRVVFEGDSAPNVGNSFEGFGRSCTITVPKGAKGWNTKIPGVWHGSKIEYAAQKQSAPRAK